MNAAVLSQVVASRERLVAFGALEWLIIGVKGSEMPLKMFLSSKSAAADVADEGLGWVVRERLLATASNDISAEWHANSWSFDGRAARVTFGAFAAAKFERSNLVFLSHLVATAISLVACLALCGLAWSQGSLA